MNAKYLSTLPLDEVWPHLEPFLAAHGLAGDGVATDGAAIDGAAVDGAAVDPERLHRAVELHRPRATNLAELAEQVVPYFRAPLDYDPELAGKYRDDPELPARLAALRERYAAARPFAVESLEAGLRELAESAGVKAAYLIHPLRMAVSGAKAGPPVFDLVEVTGREATLERLDGFVRWLGAGGGGPDGAE
jgi:glutamyl-tRNA synthetase/nondiscriminating glutamyl-tRNA synthetase